MFGSFPPVDHFASILPLLAFQSASFNKMVYPGFQALAARALQQRSVISLPAAFNQPALVRGRSSCGWRAARQYVPCRKSPGCYCLATYQQKQLQTIYVSAFKSFNLVLRNFSPLSSKPWIIPCRTRAFTALWVQCCCSADRTRFSSSLSCFQLRPSK